MPAESTLINPNPAVYEKQIIQRHESEASSDEDTVDEFDALEIFELIRNITDPEHPLTLEQLNIANIDHIKVDNKNNHISIAFTPTVSGCSMATLIGLCIRVKLLRSLPRRFKVDIFVTSGSHQQEDQGMLCAFLLARRCASR